MIMITTVVKEKMRRKSLYIISILSLLSMLLLSSANSTIAINGKPITSFNELFPVVIMLVHLIACGLAIAVSVGTIPKEYAEERSHLVWVRGVRQSVYHLHLALGNLLTSWFYTLLLYSGLVVFVLAKGEGVIIWRLLPVFLLGCLPVGICSLFASAFSLKLETFAAGFISAMIMIVGSLHPIIETLSRTLNGAMKIGFTWFLQIVPDLYDLQHQGAVFMRGNSPDGHSILLAFLFFSYQWSCC